MLKMFRKIGLLLDARQKRKMVWLVFLMLIGALLEALGITAIVDPASIRQNKYHIGDIYNLLGMHSTIQFAVVMMAAIIVVFVLKNLFLFYQNVSLLKFIYTNQFETSNRMMINFMKRPYEYYLGANTSIIQRNITSDINNVYALILTILQLTSEVIVFIILVAVLLLVDAKMIAVIAGLLIGVLMIVKWVIKPIMIRAGKQNQDFYSGLFQWISESVNAIKEIKIGGKETLKCVGKNPLLAQSKSKNDKNIAGLMNSMNPFR